MRAVIDTNGLLSAIRRWLLRITNDLSHLIKYQLATDGPDDNKFVDCAIGANVN